MGIDQLVAGRQSFIGKLVFAKAEYTLQMGDIEDVRSEAQRQLNACNKGGFILSNGCPISFDTPIRNLHALLNSVKE